MFSLAGPVDEHHQQARFTWGLGPEGAEPPIVGFDVAVAGDDGKLVTVLGFLDKVCPPERGRPPVICSAHLPISGAKPNR